jgi:ribosomal protein S18 acetylase RimI-like enzyme
MGLRSGDREGKPMGISVRSATIGDSVQIARLVSALGYPTSPAQMYKRLESILSNGDYVTTVACDGDQIVGFVGTRMGPFYEGDGRFGQIMALAVAGDHQRQGIGRMLLHAAESEVRRHEVSVLVVNSGNQRSDAHAFYEKNGYAWTGRRYAKMVGSSGEPEASRPSFMPPA